MAVTCPCIGFAYGEMGELDLVRQRPGRPQELLSLTPFFRDGENPGWESHLAVLQRWPMVSDDRATADTSDIEQSIRARTPTHVMTTGDYDHDGSATEFLLQVGAMPCGKKEAVLIGVSGADSSLHAFTSVAHPERPLVLSTDLWEQLRASNGTMTGVEWPCDDHGSDTQTEVRLSVGPNGIDGQRSEYECVGNFRDGRRAGRLISSKRI